MQKYIRASNSQTTTSTAQGDHFSRRLAQSSLLGPDLQIHYEQFNYVFKSPEQNTQLLDEKAQPPVTTFHMSRRNFS